MSVGVAQHPGDGEAQSADGSSLARFPQEARIRSSADFQLCFAARQRLSGRLLSCAWRHNDGDGARLGLAVSRRVDKRAVLRNRIKRLLRESFRMRRSSLPSLDLVITPRPQAALASAEALMADLEQLWRRVAELPPSAPQGTMPRASAVPGADDVTSAILPPTR